MSQPYPDVVRACHAEQFSAIESKYRNRLLLEGDSPEIRFGLFQISHFRKNYLNTIFRYHDLSDEIADQSLSRLMLAQAHTQAGNIKDAKEILVDFTPADDEDKRNALVMLAELSGLEKDVDALKQAMASLYQSQTSEITSVTSIWCMSWRMWRLWGRLAEVPCKSLCRLRLKQLLLPPRNQVGS